MNVFKDANRNGKIDADEESATNSIEIRTQPLQTEATTATIIPKKDFNSSDGALVILIIVIATIVLCIGIGNLIVFYKKQKGRNV